MGGARARVNTVHLWMSTGAWVGGSMKRTGHSQPAPSTGKVASQKNGNRDEARTPEVQAAPTPSQLAIQVHGNLHTYLV